MGAAAPGRRWAVASSVEAVRSSVRARLCIRVAGPRVRAPLCMGVAGPRVRAPLCIGVAGPRGGGRRAALGVVGRRGRAPRCIGVAGPRMRAPLDAGPLVLACGPCSVRAAGPRVRLSTDNPDRSLTPAFRRRLGCRRAVGMGEWSPGRPPPALLSGRPGRSGVVVCGGPVRLRAGASPWPARRRRGVRGAGPSPTCGRRSSGSLRPPPRPAGVRRGSP